MCIGIPMRVERLEPHRAWCEGRHGEGWIDLSLVGPQPRGTWLLTFLGAAREVLTEESAAQTAGALDGLAAALAGDSAGIDAAFADLVDRTPQLPDHLRSPEK
jgi:hydrogenase expression/formation protein HypC